MYIYICIFLLLLLLFYLVHQGSIHGVLSYDPGTYMKFTLINTWLIMSLRSHFYINECIYIIIRNIVVYLSGSIIVF